MTTRARAFARSARATTLMLLMVSTASAEPPTVTTLMSNELADDDAQAFVYVLEGAVEMQVKGGELVTLTPGQTFYEGPDDLHVVGRNASSTKPAKFLVVFIKDQGAPVLVPE
jgi:hypothetical protein